MLGRTTATAAAIACVVAGGAAQARPTETSERHSFNVPGAFTATAKSAGALVVSFANGGPNDGCHQLAVEIKVDGGAPQSFVVQPGNGIPPLIAPSKRGERKVEVQARLNRPCTPSTQIQGSLTLTAAEDRLTKADLTYVDRTNTVKRLMQPAVTSLAVRRNAVEAALEKAGRDAYRALERKHTATDKLIAIARTQGMLRRRLAALERTPRLQLTAAASDLLAGIRSVGDELTRLETQAVIAARAGQVPAGLNARIARAREHLLSRELRLDDLRPAAVRDQWKAVHREQSRLAAQYHDLSLTEADVEHERLTAEDVATRLLESRISLDREASALAARLATLDVDVREVEVTANGRVVFRFQGQRAQFELLAELRSRIDEAQKALDSLERVRRRAAATFYANQKALIAAEAHLEATIMRAAGLRAIIDGAFHVWDIANAFAKGGPIAAVLQASSKLIEQRIQERFQPPGGAPEPGSIEAEIKRRYGAELRESITADRMTYLVGERVARDLVGKTGRDAIGRVLADNLFDRFGAPLKPGTPSFSSRVPLPTPARIKEWLRLDRTFGHFDDQIKELQKGARLDRSVVGGITANILKDLGKSFFKRAVDEVEAAAWRDFFERDVIARSSYPVYALAKDLEWEAWDGLQALLERQQQYVDAGWDLRGYTTPVTETFVPDAQLEVRLRAAGLAASDPPLTVRIGATEIPLASRSGETLIYRSSASRLEAGAQGTLTVG